MNTIIIAIYFEMTLFDALIITTTKRFFHLILINLKKMLRNKELTHFSLSYLKTFETFKLDDIK